MRQPRLTTSESTSQRAANRRIWLLLSVTLLALTALGGTASAQSMTERVKPEPGVLIVAVGEETPASEAGLMRGDILLAIDGDMVNTAAELQHVILMQDPGDMLELTVKRGGEELTLTVTLADVDGYPLLGVAPDSPGIRGMRTRRGRFPAMRNFVRLPALERFKGMDGNAVNVGEGAVVMEVIEDSPAATAGLMAGDLITSVGETEITGMRDLAGAAAAFSPGDDVELTVDRDGETVELNVTLGAHPDDEDKAYLGVSIMPLEHLRMHMKQMQEQHDEERQSGREPQSSS